MDRKTAEKILSAKGFRLMTKVRGGDYWASKGAVGSADGCYTAHAPTLKRLCWKVVAGRVVKEN